ncbi:Hypothetical protein, putative [Bodo saltans]|uniref:Uncharacterized protein n=1 Tax=Bodo saltans TaxID=75058 RepID=A0A0S4JII8_BODSA|nr:Hypothetical protein, putative [Bodo saltans]|eukprot:CUG90364.1 Hypothetical protein, putative [Bodo saltans]
MAARDHQLSGNESASPRPARVEGGGESLNVSAVTSQSESHVVRSTVVANQASPTRRPLAALQRPVISPQRVPASAPSTVFLPGGADRQIAAILRAPGATDGGLVASNRSSRISSPGAPFSAAATRLSPLRPTSHQPSPLDPTFLRNPAAHTNTVHGVYEATMEQVADNMARLVRSAALLEAETRLVAEERNIMASSPLRDATSHTRSRLSSPVRSPMSRTLPPDTQNTTTTTNTSSSTTFVVGDHTIRRLEHQVHTGREQTKDLIHELHLLEMKMQRELAAQDREYREDRDAWRDERAAMQLRLDEYAQQVDSLKEEKTKWMTMLQEMGAGRIEAHELARGTAIQLQLLEAAHEREINGWKRQVEGIKEQLVRVRAQRDASERKMSKQGYDFAVVAEGAIRSDARMQVLQRHIHDLHVRDQKKDEHLHDVAQFVKKSLAPFVLEMNEQHIPVCRHCKKHHATFDAKHPCSQEAL